MKSREYSEGEDLGLKAEAEFQDSKVDKNVRSELIKYYRDDAEKVLQAYKNNLIEGNGGLEGKTMLDVGCGKGDASLRALKQGAIVTAIDISPKSIELLQKRAEEIGAADRLTAKVMDAQNMEIADDSFDIVFGNGILHHLPHFEQSLKEIRRVMKKGGYAVFAEPLGMNMFLRVYRKITPKMRTKDEWPFRMNEIRMIQKVFPDAQFTYFDYATLFSKFLYAIRLNKLGKKLNKRMIRWDDKHLRKKQSEKPTFFQKRAWQVVIKLPK